MKQQTENWIYETPELEVVQFDVRDIVITSGCCGGTDCSPGTDTTNGDSESNEEY